MSYYDESQAKYERTVFKLELKDMTTEHGAIVVDGITLEALVDVTIVKVGSSKPEIEWLYIEFGSYLLQGDSGTSYTLGEFSPKLKDAFKKACEVRALELAEKFDYRFEAEDSDS